MWVPYPLFIPKKWTRDKSNADSWVRDAIGSHRPCTGRCPARIRTPGLQRYSCAASVCRKDAVDWREAVRSTAWSLHPGMCLACRVLFFRMPFTRAGAYSCSILDPLARFLRDGATPVESWTPTSPYSAAHPRPSTWSSMVPTGWLAG